MLRLTPEDPGAGYGPFSVGDRTVSIGRRGDNDLVIPVSHVSSRHATIQARGGAYHLADLGSTNGSLVLRDGRRILLGPRGQPEVKLEPGDLVVLGDIDKPVRLRVAIEADDRGRTQAGSHETVVAVRERARTQEANLRVSGDPTSLGPLYRLVEAIAGLDDRDAILTRVATAALEALPGAVDALVVLGRPGAGELSVAARAHRDKGLSTEPSETICREAMSADRALLFGRHDASVLPADTLVSRGLGSGVAAPLVVGGGVVGALQVNCLPGRFELGERHLDLAVVLAHHAAQSLERADLLARLRAAESKLRAENLLLRRRTQPEVDVVASSPAMARVLDDLRRAAATDVTVLIQGETGTGKEVAARFLHANSTRQGGLLVPVNCGALSETLLDSELFGYKKGAFTGAGGDRKGVFEVARGGTVFLDEIGETPASVQVRLLRVLEEGKIKVLGEAVERLVDVRVVAATNRDLASMVERGDFRRDLYYRLRVFPVVIPPLRERPEDIEPLCLLFVRRFSRRLGKRPGPVDPALLDTLRAYPFPGNVRELANEVERALVRADEGQPLTPDLLSEELHAPPRPCPAPAASGRQPLRELVAEFEREVISQVLERHGGRRIPAAEELGLTRQGLAKKMDRLGMGEGA